MNIVWALKLLLPAVAVMLAVVWMTRSATLQWISRRELDAVTAGLVAGCVVAFLSFRTPVFAIATVLVAVWLSRRLGGGMGGRLGAYALLLVTLPPAEFVLDDIAGIGYVTALSPIRLLSLVLLLPALLNRPPHDRRRPTPGWLRLCDLGLFGYVFLMASFDWRGPLSVLVRATVEILLDVWIPYLALTRCAQDAADRRKMLAVFLIAMACQGAIATLESLTGHQFYNQLQYIYGTSWQTTWAELRAGFLRGQAAPQNPLVLAAMLLVALGAWAGLKPERPGKAYWWLLLLLLGGLWATFGRAAWLCTGLFFASLLAMPRLAGRGYLITVAALTALVGAGWSSGLGQQLTQGAIELFNAEGRESFNILYRQELLEASVALLKQSPWLGVGDFLTPLAYLKQGEGIIDLVNTYLVVALNVGLIGLGLLMTPFLVGLWRQSALVPRGTPALGHETLAWIAMTVALMALVFTVSPIRQVMQMLIWAAALGIAHLASLERPRR